MTAPTLSKSKILSGLQCPKRLWLEINKPEVREHDPELEARLNAGTEAGIVARGEWPDGVLVDEDDYARAIEMTKAWLKAPVTPLFEGFFSFDGVRVRPGRVVSARPSGGGGFGLAFEVALANGEVLGCRRLLLATGVRDIIPDVRAAVM